MGNCKGTCLKSQMGLMTAWKRAAHRPLLPPGAGQSIRLALCAALTPRRYKIDGNRRSECLSCAKVKAFTCDLKHLPVTMRQQSALRAKILAYPPQPNPPVLALPKELM